MKKTLLLLLALLPLIAFAQKKPLDHSVYDDWKNLSRAKITDDGQYISYEINPQQGDGNLYLYNIKDKTTDTFERGSESTFSGGSEFFAFTVKPEYLVTRKAKKDKKKKDEMPRNNLGVKVLPSGELRIIEGVKSFKVAADEGIWMAYLKEKPLPEKKDKKEGEDSKAGEEEKAEKPRAKGKKPESKGTELVILNPVNNKEYSFKDIDSYVVAGNGSAIAYVSVTTDTSKIDTYMVSVFDVKSEESSEIFKGEGSLKKLTASKDGSRLAFMFTSDTSDVKVYDLYLAQNGRSQKVVSCDTEGMIADWSVSENGSLSFSDSGERLFFGTAQKPVEEPEDTLLADEKYMLDIWSWHDPLLQPQQKSQLSREKRRTYTAVYHIGNSRMVQLATEEIPSVRVLQKQDGDIAIGSSGLKYRQMTSWDVNRYTDYYKVDVNTGKAELILEAAPSSVTFSPSGKQMLYWCIKSKSWKSRPVAGGETVDLTSKLDVAFHNTLHDSPSEPRPQGVISRWIEGEKYVLIYDEYDIWKFDVSGREEPLNITAGAGRKNDITFRYTSLESSGGGFRGFGPASSSDKEYLEANESIYLTAFNNTNKEAGLFQVKLNKPAAPSEIVMDPVSYRSFTKAKDKDLVIFQKGTVEEYPELYISDLKLSKPIKLTETNPQQSDYIWGTSELVEWSSFDGQTLQGILYKPENFDSSKKYPMVVYFYEKSSSGLHRYISPSPSASTINRIYAVSNGYLVFVPDIPYVEGYPGHSCYNAVVSGTYSLIDRYDYIDKTKLGLDGQSWGGYQIAYLITQTDLFACAFSGAPVSNMTSAYGGIRWESGMSRMFQYEQTQSRIGGTLWEKPIHYIENSPVFFVPKINTPVLIMHNDADGAVPWYQGIEFFVALRRLSKPAWMLSYNDEAHNLRKLPNKKDLSVRKMQFFDHYLKDAPMPYWMEKGISQIEKGKIDGYELMK